MNFKQNSKLSQGGRMSMGHSIGPDMMYKKPFESEANDNYSDTEASSRHKKNNFLSENSLQRMSSGGSAYRDDEQEALLARREDDKSDSPDEFGSNQNLANKSLKSGRQRKRQAARGKGGLFYEQKKKRRIYFCCVSSEIDIQKLHDYLVGSGGLFTGWKFHLYNDVLHMYHIPVERYDKNDAGLDYGNDIEANVHSSSNNNNTNNNNKTSAGFPMSQQGGMSHVTDDENSWKMSQKAQEVFVFEFGAAVFWGFSRGEETNLLKILRGFVTRGFVDVHEFGCGEDDIAFLTSAENEDISIENDVITFPEQTPPKQRLSVSFAIAQSAVLTIFESRIQNKIEAYKYIPEALAVAGKLQLRERQLGIMIGEVFVIRHDVNLHSEILDVPDFFWKQEKFERDYKMVYKYLEMAERTEVLNKRLDMLRDLLDVLQQQLENAHAVKLEWIVIWLIVIEVLVQVLAVGGESMGWYRSGR